MKLTCPNCGAQYEVPDDVIPQAGRDVQCSNCGDTWFQAHPSQLIDGEADDTPPPADWEEETAAPEPPAPEGTETAPDTADTSDIPDTPEPDAAPPPDARESTKTEPTPGRRQIDPAVASVLREEAERERRARAAAQGDGLEMQTDLGLQDAQDDDKQRAEARARTARLRGEDSETPKAPAPAPQKSDPRVSDKQQSDPQQSDPQGIDPVSRRSLFPDIEEINSSLAPGDHSDPSEHDNDRYPEAPARNSGGFRRGFLLAILIAVAALLIYIFAPQLSDKLPALRDVLADYVVWVDGLRLWLDGQIAALMLWLDGMASTAPAPAGDAAAD